MHESDVQKKTRCYDFDTPTLNTCKFHAFLMLLDKLCYKQGHMLHVHIMKHDANILTAGRRTLFLLHLAEHHYKNPDVLVSIPAS